MQVTGRDQLGNEQVGNASFREAVMNEECVRLVGVQRTLQLPLSLRNTCRENRILLVVLARNRYRRNPVGEKEERVGIRHARPLIEATGKPADRDAFRPAPKVQARVLERTAGAPKRLLAGFKILWQAHWRNARNRNRSARYAAAAIHHLKSEAITNVVGLGLVDFHQHILLILRGDRATRINLGPIEDADVVEVAFGA